LHVKKLFPYFQNAAAGARYGTAEVQKIFIFIDTCDHEILYRHPRTAHVSRHPPSRNDALERGGTDGTRRAVAVFLAVCLRPASETMPFNDALKPAALHGAAHADLVPFFEGLNGHRIPGIELRDVNRIHAAVAKFFFLFAKRNLDGFVAVLFFGARDRHFVWFGMDHGHGNHFPVLPDLRHFKFFAQNE
jgi:hypothetical protein